VTGEQLGPQLEFRIIWPPKTLVTLTTEPRRNTAVVLDVTAATEAERYLIKSGLAVQLVQAGVRVFALVGTESERLHDALDWILEEASMWDVLTTWHPTDSEDAAVAVVALSRANDISQIVAVLDEASTSGANLRGAILKTVSRWR
jgi:hypothetical protein